MSILNIAGYCFVDLLGCLHSMQRSLEHRALELKLKGTILLGAEGINLNLSGDENHLACFKAYLKTYPYFSRMTFRESFSEYCPFRRLKVKVKHEIITFKQPNLNLTVRAPAISPQEFKKWLDEGRDITILDTRNDYEVRFGTFKGSINLHLNDFCELPQAVADLDRNKPVVMHCTGGIRVEKAALYLLEAGFSEVYQLDGGILNYFKEVGGEHFIGECFVFDERVAVDAHLRETGTRQCTCCQGPVFPKQNCACGHFSVLNEVA